VASQKRQRKRANRIAKQEAAQPIPELTDADFERLLAPASVRDDCEHAVTRTTPDGLVLIRCQVAAAHGGGCPDGCGSWQARRIGGLGRGA
jgi:hypothetical protein